MRAATILGLLLTACVLSAGTAGAQQGARQDVAPARRADAQQAPIPAGALNNVSKGMPRDKRTAAAANDRLKKAMEASAAWRAAAARKEAEEAGQPRR